MAVIIMMTFHTAMATAFAPRALAKMQYSDQQAYIQQDFHGLQAYSPPSIWRIHSRSGVSGHTVITGAAEREKYGTLPYALHTGDEFSLGRWNMVNPSPYVSRVQCVVQSLEDGTAVLVSRGKPVTGWRRGNAPWTELHKGQSVLLGHGDQISLDCRNTEGAVFTVEEESTQGYTQQTYSAYPQPGGSPQPVPYPQQGGYPQPGGYPQTDGY